MDRIPQQEDIFSRYDKKYSIAVGVPEPTVAPSVIDFPRFELPKLQSKKEEQTPIEVPQIIAVGSKTFNVNDLINKGLYDAAEYFLGRPLTTAERSTGLGERTERTAAAKDDALLTKIDLLVKTSAEQLGVLKAAAGPKKDEDEDDDDSMTVRADGEEKEDRAAAQVSQVNVDDIPDDKLRVFAEDLRDEHLFLGRRKTKTHPGGILSKVTGITPDDLRDRIRKAQWEVVQLAARRQNDEANFVETVLGKAKRTGQFTPAQKEMLDNVDDLLADPIEAVKFNLPDDALQEGHGVRKVKPGKTPLDWRPFGRYKIARDRLEKEDVVSIVTKSHLRMNKFPNKTVSAPIRVCLLEMLDGKPMSEALLSPEDKEWLDWLLDQAQIKMIKKKPDKLAVHKTPAQMKERISVLMGEIAMGENDNPLVKLELKTLYKQAVMRDILSEEKQAVLKEFILSL